MEAFIEPSHKILKTQAIEILVNEILSKETQDIIDYMYSVAQGERTDSYKRGMIGLAAPQIGISKRIILVDIGFTDEQKEWGDLRAYINPQLLWSSEEQVIRREGCYSVDARVGGVVIRPKSIKISAFDRDGQAVIAHFSGLTARIFLHEMDHLDGIRFPNRVGENGVLHWVGEDKLFEYRDHWQNWSARCPWEVWLAMKEGRPYECPENHIASVTR